MALLCGVSIAGCVPDNGCYFNNVSTVTLSPTSSCLTVTAFAPAEAAASGCMDPQLTIANACYHALVLDGRVVFPTATAALPNGQPVMIGGGSSEDVSVASTAVVNEAVTLTGTLGDQPLTLEFTVWLSID
jgi:hypothetical protein